MSKVEKVKNNEKQSIELVDSLAVRYRPKQFSDIVGNAVNIKTIKGFLQKGQLPRSWLFSGNPGSGKTSSARLLAMTVNCENIGNNIKQGKIEPCLECTSCKLAMQNKHPDIIEINSGTEDGNAQGIRDLISSMKLAPRFSVKSFILDECLPYNTEVLLADGSYITVYEMLQNMNKDNNIQYEVKTYNHETHIIENNIVEKIWETGEKTITIIHLDDVSFCRTSDNHKWWSVTRNSYVAAGKLQVGEEVLSSKGYHLKIKKIETSDIKQPCINLTVRNNHNFYIKCNTLNLLVSNCHLMSPTAKSSLLKPIEEPPRHVMWLLCTTDPDKLPKASLTRCIKLYYEYPTIEDASKKLWRSAKQEYDEEITTRLKPFIKKIVQNTNGQMRDSYSLLESMASIIESDINADNEELNTQFVSILTSLGELSIPAIRFITHMLSDKFILPMSIMNEIEPTRFAEFLNITARHAHYTSLFFLHLHENSLKEISRSKFYGINFIRFDNALKTLYDNLIKKFTFEQIHYKSVVLCGGVLEAINKLRMGLLTPEQAVFCAINRYMKDTLKINN